MQEEMKSYIGYDYKELTADKSEVSKLIDGYKNFGWRTDENQMAAKESGQVTIRLKRDRRILNKAELTRLQRYFEDSMKQVKKLEKTKTTAALVVSITIGTAGTVFMAGSVFAVTADRPIIWLCVLFAVPGFLLWFSSYFIYKYLLKTKTEKLSAIIDGKYDEIYEICERGSRLL